MTNDQFPNDELLAFIRHSSFTHSSFSSIGECRIRTCEGISHQIYSLTRLTASVTPRHVQLSVEPPRRGPTRRNTFIPAKGRYCDRRSTKTGALRATSRDGPNPSASR